MFASGCGIPDTIVTRNDGEELKRLSELTNGQLADVVIDATGSHQSMGHALNYCAFGGRLVYVGITQEEVSFPHAPVMHRRELSVAGQPQRACRAISRGSSSSSRMAGSTPGRGSPIMPTSRG